MKILFINNHGGGFANHLEITEGTTVQQLFEKQIPYEKAANFLIRVNRQPSSSDQVLQEGDRVSITPTKIEGGSSSRCPMTTTVSEISSSPLHATAINLV